MIYLQDTDFTLHLGDVLTVLREMPSESVDCVITSPPYYGLRDYGTGAWEGGEEGCDHARSTGGGAGRSTLVGTHDREGFSADGQYGQTCGKCGATRQDAQLGLEPTPEQYVERMTEVFREVRRVLAAHGTCWVNMGDSYATTAPGTVVDAAKMSGKHVNRDAYRRADTPSGLKPKDLCGIPWRLAFALQADGWYLRSDIVWSKPNPMPESVTDRPTKAHEYVFLLTKSPRYFFDQEAVRETLAGPLHSPGNKPQFGEVQRNDFGTDRMDAVWGSPNGRNIRSVWEIATQPYPEAHFATFPEELVRRCLLAGTSERGVCPECGAPWVRVVERDSEQHRDNWAGSNRGNGCVAGGGHVGRHGGFEGVTTTLGWRPSCECSRPECDACATFTGCGRDCTLPDPIPATVLDPFMGSGTTALVARKHGRRAVGIELNAEYCELIVKRTQQLSLLAEPYTPAPVVPRGPSPLTGGAYNPPGQSPHSNAR